MKKKQRFRETEIHKEKLSMFDNVHNDDLEYLGIEFIFSGSITNENKPTGSADLKGYYPELLPDQLEKML